MPRTFVAASMLVVVLAVPSARFLAAEEARTLKGIALVIGEAKYKHLAALDNPDNDAREVKKLLDGLGFDARDLIDRDGKKLKRDLDRFVEDAEGADVALVYYSGHAIEAGGENWLVPVDADISSLAEAGERLVSLSAYLQELQQKVPLTIILLDACRSNPFPEGASLTAASSAKPVPLAAGGLAVPAKGVTILDTAEPSSPDKGQGTVLGFAAAPGNVALDGPKGGNSPYAAALLKHIAATGLDFGDVLTLVSQEVYVTTQGRQVPWTNNNLRQFLYFGMTSESAEGDEALIRGERRRLLLTIAAAPEDRKRPVEELARKDQVPLGALYGMLNMLEIAGPKDPGDLDRQLREGSEKLKSFLAERRALQAPDAELTRLSGLADEAVGQGAIKAAIGFHEKAKARIAILSATVDQAKADVRARELEFARAFAASAVTNALASDHLSAADDYRAAYERARTWDAKLAFTYKLGQADALFDHGDYKGDNAALARAIDTYAEALALSPRQTSPDDWALAQNNLGNALRMLGERESGTARLQEAVAAYRAALEERTRERVPLNWALTQTNLGNALQRLGERESGTARLLEAVAAYRAALEVRTRARLPLEWGTTQNSLGNALLRLGEREKGTARLAEAVAVFRGALEERTRERVPLDWAMTQNNLGIALWTLGRRESGRAPLEEAVAVFRAALEERTRERVPLDWAMTQSNLGNALSALGERENGTARLVEAVAAYRAALEERARERVPLQWAATQNNLGTALQMLGERESGTERLTEAVAAYRAALEERARERVPLDWAMTQNNLGTALQVLGEREGVTARLAEAVAAFRAALEERTRERVPPQWAMTRRNLGTALFSLGVRTRSIKLVEEAKLCMQSSRDYYRSEGLGENEAYYASKLAEIETQLTKLRQTGDSP